MTDQQAMNAHVEEHEDEGHSALGWICVIIMIIGFAVGTLFFVLGQPMGVYIGAGIIVLGAIAWPILKLAGLGPKAQH